MNAILELREAALRYGDRTLWQGLNLDVAPGEFVAVLGPNGAGKTSLLRVLLGERPLTAGVARIGGTPVRHGDPRVGYVPQQKAFPPNLPVRGRDLVRMGIDGHRWGLGWPNRATHQKTASLLSDVGAASLADAPVGTLSGGEQQRLRVAQALGSDPALLLCDEPLLSLDLQHQRAVAALLDRQRRERGTAVLMITHEINPILEYADRVLYLAGGRFRVGRPREVMTTEVLSELYGTRVDVVEVRGRLVIVGAEGGPADRAGASR